MKRSARVRTLVALAVGIALIAATPALAQEKYKGYARGELLITAQELKTLVDAKDPKLVILAVAEGGLTGSYTRGHIPGSFQVWRPDYEPPVGKPFPYDGMALNRADFEKFARSFGINNDSKVVIYDEKYDATRLWWLFFLYGKEDVRILDGGYYAWKEAGYDTAMGGSPDKPNNGTFVAKLARPGAVAGMTDVWRAKEDPDVQVWDTREPDEWSGETKKGKAKRAGRIPWSTFQSWKEFRTKVSDQPTAFKPAAEIQKVVEKFKMDPNKEQIFYCQSGVRTTTAIFTLYMLGWDAEKLRNYDGSWLEWSYFEENPIVVGK